MTRPTSLDARMLLQSMTLVILLVLITGGMGVYVLSDPGIEMAYWLVRTAQRVGEVYHGDVDGRRLTVAGHNGIIDKLDRFSGYVTQARFEEMRRQQSGHYSGIGVTVVRHELGLLIVSVRQDGPADEVGLLFGDIIIAADTNRLGGLGSREASLKLRGEEGTTVLLKIYRPVDDDSLEVTVTRREIPFEHVPYAGYTADSILYVRLVDFNAGAADGVRAALDSLASQENASPRGIILDLRGNPGGLFSEAYETANLFLAEGVFIVGTDGRSQWNDVEFHATGDDLVDDLPMAVIVDRKSASSSEIVAGALQQAGRAALIGDTTYGKGLVQGYVHFPDGDGLRLTISRYYFAGGVYLNDFDSTLNDVGHGLAPDYYFRFVDEEGFPMALENSFLMQQFANSHQDEIIATVEDGLDDSWIDRFFSFALSEGFVFRSVVTIQTELIQALSKTEGCSREIQRMTAGLHSQAQKDDLQCFYSYGSYLKLRFKQIALERKFSTYRAYDEVVVTERPEIQFAADVILGR